MNIEKAEDIFRKSAEEGALLHMLEIAEAGGPRPNVVRDTLQAAFLSGACAACQFLKGDLGPTFITAEELHAALHRAGESLGMEASTMGKEFEAAKERTRPNG